MKHVKDNCPHNDCPQILRIIQFTNTMVTVLKQLCEDPKTIATLSLNPLLGVPGDHIFDGRHGPIINLQLNITIVPRRVRWGTVILGDISDTEGVLVCIRGTWEHRIE